MLSLWRLFRVRVSLCPVPEMTTYFCLLKERCLLQKQRCIFLICSLLISFAVTLPIPWTVIAGEELVLQNSNFIFLSNMKSSEEPGSSWTCLTIAARLCSAFLWGLVQCCVQENGAQCLSSCSKTLAVHFQSGFDSLKLARVNNSVVCIMLPAPSKTCLKSTDWLCVIWWWGANQCCLFLLLKCSWHSNSPWNTSEETLKGQLQVSHKVWGWTWKLFPSAAACWSCWWRKNRS